jgi:hypothetical protein
MWMEFHQDDARRCSPALPFGWPAGLAHRFPESSHGRCGEMSCYCYPTLWTPGPPELHISTARLDSPSGPGFWDFSLSAGERDTPCNCGDVCSRGQGLQGNAAPAMTTGTVTIEWRNRTMGLVLMWRSIPACGLAHTQCALLKTCLPVIAHHAGQLGSIVRTFAYGHAHWGSHAHQGCTPDARDHQFWPESIVLIALNFRGTSKNLP